MRNAFFLLTGLFLFTACSSSSIEPETQKEIDVVSAASFLGDEFIFDVISRSIIRPKGQDLDVTSWHIDRGFRELLAAGAKARGKEFRELELDPATMEKIFAVRESRWKRITGKYSQALMDHLFRQAVKQGIRYFFLLTPLETHENYPLHKGNMGVYCYDRKLRKSRAYVYYAFDFTLWDVAAHKKIFSAAVDPGYTQEPGFAECHDVGEMKEPRKELEAPAREAMKTVVEKLFAQMGWQK